VDLVGRLRAAGCVFAEEEAELLLGAASSPGELEVLAGRRIAGEPLEHVLGWAQFRGLRIAVEPGVFVPRRRTELLVELALPAAVPGAVVLDLCCGSGALGAALAAERPGIDLVASDVDPVAVRCARRNVEPAGGRVFEGDLFAALPPDLRGRVDVLLVNVPYVPTTEIALMPPEARLHEPPVALDGGADGLDVLRRVAADASAWLAPDGVLLTETSDRQAPATVGVLDEGGLDAEVVADEESEATAVVARRVPGR
jgi:release factor glutamine methyltransferase